MGRSFGLIAVMIVVVIGGYLYTKQMQGIMPGGTTPKTTIDVTAVRNDLMAIANAERRYWATKATYASLEELRANGDILIPSRANYVYSAENSDSSFKIIAIYSGADRNAPKRISVDDTMALKIE
jgi:Tfp pilus assembly protein PilE